MPKKGEVVVTTPDTTQSPQTKEEDVTLDCPGGHEIVGTKSHSGKAYIFNCAKHRYRGIVPLSSPLFKE